MNRIIRKKEENYSTISNVFLRDDRLSLKSKGLLALIMSLPNDWEYTINGIIKVVKEGKASVYTALSELKEFGYCYVTVCRNDKGVIEGNDYTFVEEPHTDFPHAENPRMENQTQINIDITKERLNKENSIKENFENRKTEFWRDLCNYQEYGEKMLKDFFFYWTEPNKSCTKMRYEMEKTWETKRRLARWSANNNKRFQRKDDTILRDNSEEKFLKKSKWDERFNQ